MAVSNLLAADSSLQRAHPLLATIERAALLAIAIALSIVVSILCSRRLVGAVSTPLSSPILIALGITISAVAGAMRWKHNDAWPWLTTAITVGAALSLSLPGSGALGLIGLWLFVGLEEGWHLQRWFHAQQTRPTAFATTPPNAPIDVEPALGDEANESPPADSSVTQQLVRRRDEQGAESIHGWLRVEFPATAPTVNAHVAFCPPLAVLPECFAEQADGPSARVKIAQVLSQGARLEVKLDREFSEPQSVLVEFSACSPEGKLPLGQSAI